MLECAASGRRHLNGSWRSKWRGRPGIRPHGSSVRGPDAEHILLKPVTSLLGKHFGLQACLARVHARAAPASQADLGAGCRREPCEERLQRLLQMCLAGLCSAHCLAPVVECPTCMHLTPVFPLSSFLGAAPSTVNCQDFCSRHPCLGQASFVSFIVIANMLKMLIATMIVLLAIIIVTSIFAGAMLIIMLTLHDKGMYCECWSSACQGLQRKEREACELHRARMRGRKGRSWCQQVQQSLWCPHLIRPALKQQ